MVLKKLPFSFVFLAVRTSLSKYVIAMSCSTYTTTTTTPIWSTDRRQSIAATLSSFFFQKVQQRMRLIPTWRISSLESIAPRSSHCPHALVVRGPPSNVSRRDSCGAHNKSECCCEQQYHLSIICASFAGCCLLEVFLRSYVPLKFCSAIQQLQLYRYIPTTINQFEK